MSKPLIGTKSCGECGAPRQQVRVSSAGKPYYVCSECDAQVFARGAFSIKAMLEQTTLCDPLPDDLPPKLLDRMERLGLIDPPEPETPANEATDDEPAETPPAGEAEPETDDQPEAGTGGSNDGQPVSESGRSRRRFGRRFAS